MKLTAKQQAFCEEYIVDLNATQAAVRAGYTEKSARITASKMLSNANIATYVSELKKARSKKTEIDAAWVLAKSVILHNRCMVDGDDFSPSGAGKALDLIGKHIDVQAYSEKSVVVEMSHEEWLDSIK